MADQRNRELGMAELCLQLLVSLFLPSPTARECLRHRFNRLPIPLRRLIRMNPTVKGTLLAGLLTLDRIES